MNSQGSGRLGFDGPPRWRLEDDVMRYAVLIPLGLLASTAVFAQPSIQIGPREPREIEIDPAEGPEEQVIHEEGGCRITIVRRTDKMGRRITRRIRECDEDDEE